MIAQPFYPRRRIKKLCPKCQQPILAGTQAVRKYSKGQVFWHYRAYHLECWKKSEHSKLESKIAEIEEWFIKNLPTKKQMFSLRASPIAFQQRRNIKALLRYYRRKGNIKKIAELERRIKCLEEDASEIYSDTAN